MKMKKLFSFTLSILFLLGAVSPALAIDEELFPAEPEITEDTQVPDEAVPPVDEPFPDVPPVVDEPFPDEDRRRMNYSRMKPYRRRTNRSRRCQRMI